MSEAKSHNLTQAEWVAGVEPKLIQLRQYCLTEAVKLHGFTGTARPATLVESVVVINTAENFMKFLIEGKKTAPSSW